MITKPLVDAYELEIIARARAAEHRAERLTLDDFISDSPRNLAHALQNVFEYLIKVVDAVSARIDWINGSEIEIEQDLRVLRVADEAVKYFAAHLRYVDSARTEKLPWEIIPSFERLVRDLSADAQIMLRPMWHYNYATTVANFRDLYLRRLSSFELYLPDIDVESRVLYPLLPAFHMISFPALERENILLHSLIGHEIGHLLAGRFLTPARVSAMLTTVRDDVERLTDDQMRREELSPKTLGELFFTQRRNRRVATNLDLAISFWYRAVEELSSDLVGAILFGPASLFATMDMAVQFGLDEQPSPQNDFYPPWRMRVRYVQQAVRDGCPSLFTKGADSWLAAGKADELLSDFVSLIEREASLTSDEARIAEIALAQLAYRHVHATMIESLAFLGDELDAFAFDETLLRSSLKQLVERLDHGIPPNAIDASVESPTTNGATLLSTAAGLVDIINAAWFHKIVESSHYHQDVTLDDKERLRRRRNRLTLKAIEFAYIQRDFEAWHKRPSAPLPRPSIPAMDGAGRYGVLTAPELIVAMQNPSLADRLVVTPLLDYTDTVHDASIDLRLGTEFVVLRKQMMPNLNIAHARELLAGVEKYQQRFVRRIREEIVLHPGQLIVGSTLEYVQIPPGLMCYVIGKSTWGRTGLVIATATKIDPGFRGCVTLEMINQGEVPIVLVPGVPIAQLVFHKTDGATTYKGVYSCPVGPEFPRFDAIVKAAAFWLPEQ
ncbi:MAG: dCTP deaminase [Thermoanaerobaculia bacterium]